MAISEAQFNAFCDDLETMLESIGEKTTRHYNEFASKGQDYILKVPDAIFASVIFGAFSPMCINARGHYYNIAEFNVTNSDGHEGYAALLTHEGRQAAYHRLPELIGSIIFEQSGGYDRCLDEACEHSGVDKEEIEAMVQSKVDEYQVRFNDTGDYLFKNAVLFEMAELYGTTRNADTLETFITENRSSTMHP